MKVTREGFRPPTPHPKPLNSKKAGSCLSLMALLSPFQSWHVKPLVRMAVLCPERLLLMPFWWRDKTRRQGREACFESLQRQHISFRSVLRATVTFRPSLQTHRAGIHSSKRSAALLVSHMSLAMPCITVTPVPAERSVAPKPTTKAAGNDVCAVNMHTAPNMLPTTPPCYKPCLTSGNQPNQKRGTQHRCDPQVLVLLQ